MAALGLGNGVIFQNDMGLSSQAFSLSFDGDNDQLTLGNVLNLGTADFSFSYWVNLPDVTSKNLITKFEDNDNAIYLMFATDKIDTIIDGGGNLICNHPGETDMTALQDTWVHICHTADRDGDTAIYVNGIADGGSPNYGRPLHDMENDTQNVDNTGSWQFMASGGSSRTEGFMTDVAFYNVALSATHVGEIYNGGTPFDLTTHSQNSALTGYWRFNEGSGSTVADEIGSNDLTIVGATWSTNIP